MDSDQIGLKILTVIVVLALYGLFRLVMDIKKYFIRRKRQSDRIIGRFDE